MKFKRKNISHVYWAPALSLAILIFLFVGEVMVKPWLSDNTGLVDEYAKLREENRQLKQEVERLQAFLNKDALHIMEMDRRSGAVYGTGLTKYVDIPDELASESTAAQQAYRRLALEKRHWDILQRNQYRSVLDSTVEPISLVDVELFDEENRKYFIELESSLKLHKKLVRDVRIFHDEIEYEQEQYQNETQYLAYDDKLKLEAFARESGIADAMQQAMSALSVGIYRQEASAVLDRLGDEFTRPVEQEYERLLYLGGATAPGKYNYNIYIMFGKKIMDYADALARQSSIFLAPNALGELDYLYRRLNQTFFDLYEIGQYENYDSVYLDMEELERNMY